MEKAGCFFALQKVICFCLAWWGCLNQSQIVLLVRISLEHLLSASLCSCHPDVIYSPYNHSMAWVGREHNDHQVWTPWMALVGEDLSDHLIPFSLCFNAGFRLAELPKSPLIGENPVNQEISTWTRDGAWFQGEHHEGCCQKETQRILSHRILSSAGRDIASGTEPRAR